MTSGFSSRSSICLSPPSPQIPTSDSPSPPPGLTKPSLVVPISVSDLTARSPFEGAAAESQSLFSDNSNFRHPNPLPAGLPPFPSSPRGSSDWPMTPEPQSLFTSGTVTIKKRSSFLRTATLDLSLSCRQARLYCQGDWHLHKCGISCLCCQLWFGTCWLYPRTQTDLILTGKEQLVSL